MFQHIVDFYGKLVRGVHLDASEIEENFEYLKIGMEIDRLSLGEIEQGDLIALAQAIPNTLVLSFSCGGIENSFSAEEDSEGFLADYQTIKSDKGIAQPKAKFELLIDKKRISKELKRPNTTFIYSSSHFVNFLKTLNLQILSQHIADDSFNFWVFLEEKEVQFQTYSLACVDFEKYKNGDFASFSPDRRKDRLNKRKEEVSGIYDFTLIPEDFHFIAQEGKICNLKELFQNRSTLLSFLFLANSFDYRDGVFDFLFKGYRQVRLEIEEARNLGKNKIFEIYEWVYSSENVSDKIGLVRNLLTLHSWDGITELLQKSSKLFDSVKSNYAIYLKKNTELYLSTRQQLETEILEGSQRVLGSLDKFLDLFAKMFFSVIILVVSFVISYLVKGSFDLKQFKIGLLMYSVLSFVVLLCGAIFYRSKRNFMLKEMRLLEDRFGELISPQEVKRLVNPATQKNRAHFNLWFWGMIILWSLISGALLFLSVTTYLDKLLTALNLK